MTEKRRYLRVKVLSGVESAALRGRYFRPLLFNRCESRSLAVAVWRLVPYIPGVLFGQCRGCKMVKDSYFGFIFIYFKLH